MSRRLAFCLIGALFCLGSIARADFTFTSTRVPDPSDPSKEAIEFFARSDGRNTGTKILASDITVIALDQALQPGQVPLTIKFVSSAASAKADLTGSNAPVENGVVVPDRSFVNLLANDGNDDPTAYNVVSTVPVNTHSNYAAVPITRFEVVGANLSGGVNATTANDGKGAMIAVAVVPRGMNATIQGSIGGDAGQPFPFVYNVPVPEPGATGVMAVVAGCMAARRPRQRCS